MMLDEHSNQPLAPYSVDFIEPRENRAVEVKHAHHPAVLDQRHDQLGARVRIAGDVPGKLVDIRDQHRLAARRCRTAHAPADRDAQAGGLPLERPQHQLVSLAPIKPGPAELGQLVIDQRRHVGGVGDPVGFAFEQGHQLHGKFAVNL